LRNNNFDAIRLLLAFSVFLSHSFPISGLPIFQQLGKWANAAIAVQSFFVISGFLIFMSYDRSKSLSDYSRKRACRIYPAYFAVVMICALVGLVITDLPWQEYVSKPLWLYLATNLSFLNYLHPELPGVFTTNPIPVINGALWTIKVEVMFYISVPVLSWLFVRLPRIPLMVALYIGGLIYKTLCHKTGHYSLEVQLPGQIQFFLSGALLYYYQPQFLRYARPLLAVSVAVTAVELYFGVVLLLPLSLAVIVIYVALCMPGLNRIRPAWDLSYGYYIWHFPVLQMVTFLGWFANPWAGLTMAGAITAAMACLSWVGVERRFLKRPVSSGRVRHGAVVMQPQAESTPERTV
jgi:peptidoglycan/LPS O-acetylase OafA/YrhL